MKEKIISMSKDLWFLVEEGIAIIKNSNDNIIYNNEKYNDFEKKFISLYEEISVSYMKHNGESLDRHKVAAILMISIIEAKVLSLKEEIKGYIFFGNYVLAVDTGLNYMLAELNKQLENKKIDLINNYFFPNAMACDTDYYRIFYRNLYYSDINEKWSLNPLDIADKLFLIEYLTLKENNIDPSFLKEYKI